MPSFSDRVPRCFTRNAFALLILFLIAVPTLYFTAFNEVCEGQADNYWHYYYSRYAFRFPHFFFHHWGKPFFILLTAPVAQLGFLAVNVFNVMCGLASAYIAYLWSRKAGFRYPWMAIIISMFTPMYYSAVQSALTEPLFSLILIATGYLLFNEKYLWGSLLASTLLFSRSEGMFILMILAFYLLIRRKYVFIPLLGTALLIYAVAGRLYGKDFWWYFTENPYNPVSPYGHGSYFHFLSRYWYSFGVPFSVLFVLGALLMINAMILNRDHYFLKEKVSDSFRVFFLAGLPSIAFFVFHSYAWGAGKYGSAGLERVLACIIPSAAMIGMKGFQLVARLKYMIPRSILLVFVWFSMIRSAFINFSYPAKAVGAEKVEREAVKWFKQVREPGTKIYYAHPALVFFAGWDPYDEDNKECMGFPNSNCIPYEGDQKFYYIWDSYFSKSSCGNSLEDIERCPNLRKMREYSGDMEFRLVFFESK